MMQIVVVFVLIAAVLVVLLMIRSAVATVEKQVKKVSLSLQECRRWESEEEEIGGRGRGEGSVNKVFLKKDGAEDRDVMEISYGK